MTKLPNILVCGTPGTGKSTHCALLVDACPQLTLLTITDLVKSEKLYLEYDDQWSTYIVDDEKLLDYLEPLIMNGGCLIDWHDCQLFPDDWIDLVVVLTCDHTILWDRLEKRNYTLKKIQENNEAEIMQVILNEAHDTFQDGQVVVLKSETLAQVDENIDRVQKWIESR